MCNTNPGPALVDPNHRQHLSEMATNMCVGSRKIDPGWSDDPITKGIQKGSNINTKITQNLFVVCAVYSTGSYHVISDLYRQASNQMLSCKPR